MDVNSSLKILSNAKKPEIICAFALANNSFFGNNLIVGDAALEKLPDIYDENKTYGVEIVQIEKPCDFKMQEIGRLCKKFNGNYYQIKQVCDNRYPNQYDLTEYDGKLVAFSSNERTHAVDWMKDIYEKEIDKKLGKLNKGNYSGIYGEIDLCISIVQRRKRFYDVKLILYKYLQCLKKYQKGFDKIFIITSENIFMLEPQKIISVTPIIKGSSIIDFQIIGNDYFLEIAYDYDVIVKKASKYFSYNSANNKIKGYSSFKNK